MKRTFLKNKKNKGLPFTFLRKGEGFTLVETLVVIAIMGILLLVITPSYNAARKTLALNRSASRLAQDIRSVQEMAVSAKECDLTECLIDGNPAVPLGGYGIFLELPFPTFYILFPDIDGDNSYSSGDSTLEQIELEKGIVISGFFNCSATSIVFTSPDPIVTINKNIASCPGNKAVITLCIEGTDCSDPTNIKTITVNKVGLIYID